MRALKNEQPTRRHKETAASRATSSSSAHRQVATTNLTATSDDRTYCILSATFNARIFVYSQKISCKKTRWKATTGLFLPLWNVF